jgi:putative tryptophan/tyrosine transport system substrate-binding protein
MRRRDFIKVVSAGILAWPLAARGQQSGKTWRLGFIAHRHESFYDGLFEGLRELGYVEGKTSLSNAGMQKATRNDFRTLRLKWFG